MILVFSWTSNNIRKHNAMSNTNQRKMWNSIAHWGGAAALLSLYLFDTSIAGAMFLLTAAVALNSGIYTGFLTNHMDLAPNFAGTLMGITNTMSNCASISGPLFIGFIVTDSVRFVLFKNNHAINILIFCFRVTKINGASYFYYRP